MKLSACVALAALSVAAAGTRRAWKTQPRTGYVPTPIGEERRRGSLPSVRFVALARACTCLPHSLYNTCSLGYAYWDCISPTRARPPLSARSPAAGWMREDCVHAVPSGATLSRTPAGMEIHDESGAHIRTLPECPATADEPLLLPSKAHQRSSKALRSAGGASRELQLPGELAGCTFHALLLM